MGADTNKHTDIFTAVSGALAIQAGQSPGYGAGVSFDPDGDENYFVQWAHRCEDGRYGLDLLELRFGETRDDLRPVVESHGYRLHPDNDLAEINMWTPVRIDELGWDTEGEMIAFLVEQLQLIGARDGMTFTSYP